MRSVLEAKARQIAYCIQQAQEYYKAAESVTVRTSPLLYFYGMLSLAKAVIVANNPEKMLDNVKYHGLKADKSVQSEKLEDQTAIIDRGVFEDLSATVEGSGLPKAVVIRFGDLLSISPELGEMYERLLNRACRSIANYDLRVNPGYPVEVVISTSKSAPFGAFERIPELQKDFETVPGRPHDTFVSLRSKPGLREFPAYLRKYESPVGGRYFVGAVPASLCGEPISCCVLPPLGDYIAMFILANCVRYKQDLWGEVVQGRETGILGLVDLLLAISRRRFPSLVLDRLFGEHFDYGAPGRIS